LTPIAEEQPDGSSEEIDLTDVSGIGFESGEEPGFVIEAYILPSVWMTTDEVELEMQDLIEKAETWTEETAPQTLSEFPFMPESVFDLFHNIENADSHLEKDGDTYTWKTNLAEILPSDYFSEKEIGYRYFEDDSWDVNSVEEIDPMTFQFNRSDSYEYDYLNYRLFNKDINDYLLRDINDNLLWDDIVTNFDYQDDELVFSYVEVCIFKYTDKTCYNLQYSNWQYRIDWVVYKKGQIAITFDVADISWVLVYDTLTGALTYFYTNKAK